MSPDSLLECDRIRWPNVTGLSKNDIVVADRAYGTLPGVGYLMGLQADYVLRVRGSGFSIYDQNEQKIDLLAQFTGLKEGESAEVMAYCLINGRYEPVRFCAFRKDEDSERKGLKKLVKINQRKRQSKPVSDLQQNYNKYIIVMTSLGQTVSCAQVLELYRMRWQIEIAFKHLKSIFRYNEMPARLSENILTWFYGKLLLAALCETMVNTGRFSPSRQR